jgi:hypothetical protein
VCGADTAAAERAHRNQKMELGNVVKFLLGLKCEWTRNEVAVVLANISTRASRRVLQVPGKQESESIEFLVHKLRFALGSFPTERRLARVGSAVYHLYGIVSGVLANYELAESNGEPTPRAMEAALNEMVADVCENTTLFGATQGAHAPDDGEQTATLHAPPPAEAMAEVVRLQVEKARAPFTATQLELEVPRTLLRRGHDVCRPPAEQVLRALITERNAKAGAAAFMSSSYCPTADFPNGMFKPDDPPQLEVRAQTACSAVASVG